MCGGGTGVGRTNTPGATGGLLSNMNLPQLGQNGFGMPQQGTFNQPTFQMQQPPMGGTMMNQFQHSASGPAGGVTGTPGAQNLSPEDYQLYGHHQMMQAPMAPQGAAPLTRPY